MSQLPPLDLSIIDTDWLAIPSQGSSNKFSQMSPLQAYTSRHSSVSKRSAPINLDIPASPRSPGSYRLPSHLGQSSSPNAKATAFDDMPDFVPFQADDFDQIPGIGLEFDGDGNLLGIADDEPELPPFFTDTPGNASLPASGAQPHPGPLEEFLVLQGDQVLPDAEAFSAQEAPKTQGVSETGETVTSTETVQTSAPLRRRRPKRIAILDNAISLPRSEQRRWMEHYAEISGKPSKHSKDTAPHQAKKNAISFVFDNGIANVGTLQRSNGVSHPLAADFNGWNLLAQLHPEALGLDAVRTPQRGRRRTSQEAFDDEATPNQRNVKARHDHPDTETGRGVHPDALQHPIPGHEDSYVEMGMDAMPAMEDHHSSSLMPWSRAGSAVPGSSVRNPGSARKSAAPSPLLHRSTDLGAAIQHHSDPAEVSAATVGADFSGLDSSMDMDPVLDFEDPKYASLDLPSREFLDYASKRAVVHGHGAEEDARRWVDFEHISSPLKHDAAIAAQAFLHVLTLATRGVVSVRQENNRHGTEPFGQLEVGITMTPDSND